MKSIVLLSDGSWDRVKDCVILTLSDRDYEKVLVSGKVSREDREDNNLQQEFISKPGGFELSYAVEYDKDGNEVEY